MPKVQVILNGGKIFEGEHLALPLEIEAEREKCRSAKPGDEIEFRARIDKTGGLFPPFDYIDDTAQMKVFFSLSLEEVEIVRVVAGS